MNIEKSCFVTVATLKSIPSMIVFEYPPENPTFAVECLLWLLGLQSDLQQQRRIAAALLFLKFTFTVCGPEHFLLYIYIYANAKAEPLVHPSTK